MDAHSTFNLEFTRLVCISFGPLICTSPDIPVYVASSTESDRELWHWSVQWNALMVFTYDQPTYLRRGCIVDKSMTPISCLFYSFCHLNLLLISSQLFSMSFHMPGWSLQGGTQSYLFWLLIKFWLDVDKILVGWFYDCQYRWETKYSWAIFEAWH